MSSDASSDAPQAPRGKASPPAIAQFRPGGRCVLLLHTLNDGSEHVDWLSESTIAPADDGPDARTLIAYRLPDALDQLPIGAAIAAQRLADHRRLYLDFEGQLTGDRGQVKRLTQGKIVQVSSGSEATVRLSIIWQAGEYRGAISQGVCVEADAGGLATIVRCESRANAAQ